MLTVTGVTEQVFYPTYNVVRGPVWAEMFNKVQFAVEKNVTFKLPTPIWDELCREVRER